MFIISFYDYSSDKQLLIIIFRCFFLFWIAIAVSSFNTNIGLKCVPFLRLSVFGSKRSNLRACASHIHTQCWFVIILWLLPLLLPGNIIFLFFLRIQSGACLCPTDYTNVCVSDFFVHMWIYFCTFSFIHFICTWSSCFTPFFIMSIQFIDNSFYETNKWFVVVCVSLIGFSFGFGFVCIVVNCL